MVLNWWFLAGALIAAALEIPDIWWQATHGWATIAMTQSLNQNNGGAGKRCAGCGSRCRQSSGPTR
jgi:hypothetical protein